ncbi:MAG: hypothetical protein A3H45_10175 [Ignavibacteria bacterium RIFCSPLOWO2_02_FULL_55_14]|nr:MAG: hypothetical protein A3H45_10175 [Ignavibacteria bacterium RIFCSPLOWO2_02_FULL_55_14]
MKEITADVNGLRVQHLMKELQALGIREVGVIEYVSSIPKISVLRLLCDDREVESVRSLIDRTAQPAPLVIIAFGRQRSLRVRMQANFDFGEHQC